MAVLRTVNWISQQRVDLSDMRAVESAVRNDFDQLISGFVTSPNKGYVLKGFEILMAGAVGGAANGLQVFVDGASIFHVTSDLSGTFYSVQQGTLPQTLNSALNPIVDGAFVPNSINYVSLEYERYLDPDTAAQVYLWNPTTNTESIRNAPRAQILRYRIKISTSSFAQNTLPIATVITDSGNNVVSVTDARNLLFRLGSGGATPNPYHKYPWNAQTEGRTENPSTSTSSASPFRGGDKMLYTLKDWMDAVMTSISEIKGSTYWYSSGSSISNINLTDLFSDAAFSVMTGTGRFKHVSAGLLQWTSTLSVTQLTGRRIYTIDPNPVGISIQDGQVAYINLVRSQDFQSANSFTVSAGSYTINASTTVVGLSAGDYVKFAAHPDSAWRKVANVSGTVITLEGSPEPAYPLAATATKLLRSKGTYTVSDVIVSNREDVPADGNTYWIAYRKDGANFSLNIDTPGNNGATRQNGIATFKLDTAYPLVEGQLVNITGVSDSSFDGIREILEIVDSTTFKVVDSDYDVTFGAGDGQVESAAKIYLRWLGEISQGESIEIDGQVSAETLEYIGASSETDNQPNYSSNIRGASLENLTKRLGTLTDAIGDSQEDRSAFLKSDEVITWTGDQIEFTSDIILEIVNTKSGTVTEHTIQASESPIVVGNGDSIWISANRLLTSENVTVNNSSVTPIPAQDQANKDIFVLFKRIDSVADGIKLLYLPLHKQLLTEGQTTRLGQAGGGSAVVKASYLDPVNNSFPVGSTYTVDGQSAVDGDTVLFTKLSNPSDNNKIYEISGVGTAIQWKVVRAFSGFPTPTDGDSVRILSGNMFREQLAVFDGTKFLINDTVRLFDEDLTDFIEVGSIKSIALVNNTTDTVFSVNVSGSENWLIPYSIFRGTSKETGYLTLTSDGIEASVNKSNSYIGDAGVSFDATVSAGVLTLSYTADNSGANGTLKIWTQRWSDTIGGPTGVPSYSGSGGGSGAAAGANLDIQWNSGGNLAGDSRYKWNPSEGAVNLNGMLIGVLSTPVTLLDNQAAPVTAFSYNAASNRFVFVDYSIERNGSFRNGTIMIPNNGSTVSPSDVFAEAGTTGITMSAIVNGGNIEVQYTSTNTGNDATLKYSIRRWS
jgi:hypothetical protein